MKNKISPYQGIMFGVLEAEKYYPYKGMLNEIVFEKQGFSTMVYYTLRDNFMRCRDCFDPCLQLGKPRNREVR